MSSKIKVDTIENVAGSGNVSLGSGHNLVVPGDLTVDTSTLKVDSSNNRVGIGTASPSQTLETAGNIFVNTSGNPNLTVKTTGAGNNPFVRIQADTNYWDLQSLFSNTNDELDFRYNGTSTMMIDKNGVVTKPLQPAFLAFASANSNLAIDVDTTVGFGTEVYDQNGDFSSNIFTAPITGRYLLTANLYSTTIVANATYFWFYIETSNRTYSSIVDPGTFGASSDYHSLHVSAVADMDANDTAKVRFRQSGGSALSDLGGGTFFSGCLLA